MLLLNSGKCNGFQSIISVLLLFCLRVFFLVYKLSFAFGKEIFCSSEVTIKDFKDQLLVLVIVQYIVICCYMLKEVTFETPYALTCM